MHFLITGLQLSEFELRSLPVTLLKVTRAVFGCLLTAVIEMGVSGFQMI